MCTLFVTWERKIMVYSKLTNGFRFCKFIHSSNNNIIIYNCVLILIDTVSYTFFYTCSDILFQLRNNKISFISCACLY